MIVSEMSFSAILWYGVSVSLFATLVFGVLKRFTYVQGKQSGSNVFKIVKMIMEQNYAPVIIFSFGKKEYKRYALQTSKLDFNTGNLHPVASAVHQKAIHTV